MYISVHTEMFVEHHKIDSMCVYVYIRSHLHEILRLDAPRIRPMPRICTGLPWRRRLALESAHSLCQRLHDGALTFHEFNQLVMSCSHAVSWNLEDIPALSRAAKMRCVWDLKTVIASREAHDPKPQWHCRLDVSDRTLPRLACTCATAGQRALRHLGWRLHRC